VNAASLFVVFVLAKAAVLWGRSIPWSPWTVVAYVWQDVLVALVFGAIAAAAGTTRRARRTRAVIYWAVAAYAALNIPVAIVLSTPLTWPMLRAASGTLADSILLYATWTNAAFVALTLAAAAIVPRVLVQAPPPVRAIGVAAAVVIIAIGPTASRRVDTLGLHRNVVVALVGSALPQVEAIAAEEDWTSPSDPSVPSDPSIHSLPSAPSTPVTALRGIAKGRNVVLVSLESTGAGYLRLYGGTHDVTPNLDRLARSGVVFESAYAVYPESIKGLFSILCSAFPAFDTTPEMYATAPCRSIAAVLSDAGYSTALFHSGRFGYLGMESIVHGRGYDTLEDAASIGGQHESSFGVEESATVARMLSWIDAQPADRPFFLTYLPIAGHHPYETPEPGPFPTREEIGRYRNAVHYGDQSLGALIAGLRARGLEQRTVWIVLGDHGEALGQHEGNYGHTFFLYDENVRVPFVVAAPGLLEHQQRSPTIVSLVDTAPTILDAVGITAPAEYQGGSALDGQPRMALFFTDYSLALLGLRDGRWKFVHELASQRSKLFDLDRDPGETIDVSTDHASRTAAYVQRLRRWSAAQKAGRQVSR
jgi:membrane-anchored protein YejM (alkaline phosphatase superfamily)